MIVLGFDTATPSTAVGLMLAGGRVLEARDDPQPGERPAHAERLLPLAHRLLTEAGISWKEVERVAVGIGPGTFTGLRIGVASARALAQSLGAPITGVSSLHALALAAAGWAQPASSDPPGGPVLAAIDARRGEVFAAAWASGEQLDEPRALAPESLAAWIAEIGPPGSSAPWLGVGDGAVRFRPYLQAAGVVVPADGAAAHRVSPAAICRLGVDGPPLAPEAVLPDYRRRPDAEMTARSQETSPES